jgi:hypothetical protein
MKKIGILEEDESKKQCYIMVGHQIKYEPAWVMGKQRGEDLDHRGFLRDTRLDNCAKSVS